MRRNIPVGPEAENIETLLDYFDKTYVSGTVRNIRRPTTGRGPLRVHLRRVQPMFPPGLWNVHEQTVEDHGDRTNNLCESWNNGFRHLIGHSHPSIYVAIEGFQIDKAMVSTAMLQDQRGQPPVKRVKRSTKHLQQKLHNICIEIRDGRRSIQEALAAFGHIIRFNE